MYPNSADALQGRLRVIESNLQSNTPESSSHAPNTWLTTFAMAPPILPPCLSHLTPTQYTWRLIELNGLEPSRSTDESCSASYCLLIGPQREPIQGHSCLTP